MQVLCTKPNTRSAHASRCIYALCMCLWCSGLVMSTKLYTKLADKDYEFAQVMKWNKKRELLEYDMLIVPINFKDAHWGLGIINKRDKKFQYPLHHG